MSLDKLGKDIIRLLQKGSFCKPKITEIAEELDVPSSTVHSRIKKMEDEEIIKGYPSTINAGKIGKPLTVFALVKLEYPKSSKETEFDEKVAEKIKNNSDQVQEIHSMTGEWELLVKIKAKDADDYYRVAKESIVPAGEIKKIKGLFALNTVKESNQVFP